MLDRCPDLPALGGGHLDDRRVPVQQERHPAHGERLAGHSLGHAERHVEDGLGVFDAGGAADGEHLGLPDRRRLRVEGLSRFGWGDPAAQPPGPDSGRHRSGVPGRDEHGDLTGLVEPAGAVGPRQARHPAGAVPRLPHERRLPGVDADALHPAVEAYGDDAPGYGGGQPEQQGVARLRTGLEAGDVLARAERRGAVGLVPGRGGGDQPDQRTRHDRQVLGGREDHGLLGLTAGGGDLRAGREPHRVRLGGGEPEVDVGAGDRRREQLHAEQVEEGGVVPVGHPVEPVEQLVDHVRERLDERDPGVRHVVVGPFGRALLDVPLGLVDELLEAPVVQVGGRQGHQAAPASSELASGLPEFGMV